MDKLRIKFNATSRRELLYNIRQFLSVIVDSSLQKLNKPLVIFVNGPPNSGKSLIWDELRTHILLYGGKLNENLSLLNDEFRGYETWEGSSAIPLHKQLIIFQANLACCDKNEKQWISDHLRYAVLTERVSGPDVLILNNTDNFPEFMNSHKPNLSIKLKANNSDNRWNTHVSIKSMGYNP